MYNFEKRQHNSICLNISDCVTIKILKRIIALNIYEDHGYDDISIRMIKVCDKSLSKPLIILFKTLMKSSYYPDIWRRSNVIPVHKKNDKKLVNN